MLEVATKPVMKLGVISSLFEILHENSISYCHWKSNEHLGASMQGLTDLDVLFASDQREKIESLLRQLGFKKFNAIKQKLYKDILDFLILDPDSGKVVHLHTHYRLTMGEPYLKGYQFTSDIENGILSTRIFNETYGLFCIQPAFELILLFFREALKLRHRDIFLPPLKTKARNNEFVQKEYHWLRARTTDQEIGEVIKVFFNDDRTIYNIVSGDFNGKQLQKLSSIIKSGNSVTRLYTPLNATLHRWYREATVILSRKMSALLQKPILFKRINPRGGIVVAVIGADGSGKSTITENLKNTFDGKLDVYKVYFGRGDGTASRSRKLLSAGKTYLTGRSKQASRQAEAFSQKPGLIRIIYKCVEALIVAREKRRNLNLMQIARRRGALVICDRYPQNQVMGYNDGPLLHAFARSQSLLLRKLARIEAKVYAEAENHPPDIVFKLVADADVVEKRKSGETSLEKLMMKIQGIKGLKFNPAVRVITVDASKPLPEVLHFVRGEIWKIM